LIRASWKVLAVASVLIVASLGGGYWSCGQRSKSYRARLDLSKMSCSI